MSKIMHPSSLLQTQAQPNLASAKLKRGCEHEDIWLKGNSIWKHSSWNLLAQLYIIRTFHYSYIAAHTQLEKLKDTIDTSRQKRYMSSSYSCSTVYMYIQILHLLWMHSKTPSLTSEKKDPKIYSTFFSFAGALGILCRTASSSLL